MDKSKELLPLGSVVYLEEGTQKLRGLGSKHVIVAC